MIKRFFVMFRPFPGVPRWLPLLLSLLSASGVAWGQAYNWKSAVVNGGGFVSGIVPHPSAPGLMYCRTDIGGAYRWNATNNSWVQLLDFLGYPNNEWSLTGVESIGLDPRDTNRLYLTCGWLGAGNPNEIMISTNQGASFTRVNSPFIVEANSDGRGNGERLAVDPNLGGILFYGTRLDGLWKSVNYGANWSKAAGFTVTNTANGVGLVFVEFIQSSGTPGSATPVIWVGVSQGGTNLYRSTDGGSTWTGVTNGAPSNYVPHRAAQDGLGNLYVTFCDAPGPNGISAGVVRKFNLTTLASMDVTPPTGQGGFAGVSVDRQNPDIVAVSTMDRWWPHEEIYRSTNGGSTWTALYANATVDVSSAPWVTWHNTASVVQSWTADVKIDPFNSNHLFHVSGGGVYSSFDFAAAQPGFQFRSDGIQENAYLGGESVICSPPSGAPQLFAVFGDMGGFAFYNLDAPQPDTNFFNPVDSSNGSIDFAELNPNLLVRTYWNNTDRNGLFSTNAGSTWTSFPTHPAAVDTNGLGVIAISANGGRLVWVVAGQAPFYSTDNGATWNPCGGNATPTYSWEQPDLASDRVNPNKFYLYLPSTGVVYVSTDGGANFSAGATIASWGDGIHTTYGQEGHVWMASGGGLWRSTNSGAGFFQVPGVQAAHTVGFGRPNGGVGYPVLYLHGEVSNTWGIFRSENQGTNWTRINDDAHQFGNIAQVTGDPKIHGRCYLAAGGRGVLYGDLPNQPPFTPASLAATASNAAVALTWPPATGAGSYLIGRSLVSGGPYTNLATGVTATNYLDTGLVNGTAYYYVVAATNIYGVSSNSAEVSATPMAKLTGTIIGSPGSWGNSGNTVTNVFDGNTNTYYDAVDASGDWAGLDLGSGAAARVMQIKYCPRPGFAGRMTGGQFQGANVADFSSGVVTLFTVGSTPPEGVMTGQAVTNAASFRYLRYLGPAGGYGNVAEVEFGGNGMLLPAITLSSSKNPSGFKDNVTLGASVLTNGVVAASASGTVTFSTNGVAYATNNVSNGTASMALNTLPRGTNFITAIYSGDAHDLPGTNRLSQVVTNHPPVAGNATYVRNAGTQQLCIVIGTLLTNVTDVDGDIITLVGTGMSTNGVVVTMAGTNYLVYNNTNNVADQFSYTVTDGFGGTNTGVVNLLVNGTVAGQMTGQFTSFTNHTARLTFYGIPDYRYVTERSTNLTVWADIVTNVAATNGVIQSLDNFSDLGSNVPASAYYRLKYQP